MWFLIFEDREYVLDMMLEIADTTAIAVPTACRGT